MNEGDLTLAVSKRFFLTRVEAGEIIRFILSKTTEDLTKGKRVYFRGFGSFIKEMRSSKKVRHPKTGQIITIPERITIDFNPSGKLINAIAKRSI